MRFLAVIVVFQSFTVCYAQSKRSLEISISGGISVSRYLGADAQHQEYNLTFNPTIKSTKSPLYKAELKYAIAPSIWIALEYAKVEFGADTEYQKLERSPDDVEDYTYTRSFRNKYSMASIFAEWRSKTKFPVFVKGGFYYSKLTRSHITGFSRYIEVINREINQLNYADLNYNDTGYTNDDMGIVLGTGLMVPLTTRLSLVAEISASIGLKKVDAKNNNETYNTNDPNYPVIVKNYFGIDSNSKNFAWQLAAGISYKIFNGSD